MENNKKDYLLKTIGLQFLICTILFGLIFLLSKTENQAFKAISKIFSEKIQKNITADDVEDVFNSVNDYISSYSVDGENEAEEITAQNDAYHNGIDEELLSAKVFSNEKDSSVECNSIPKNVSTVEYKLNMNIFCPVKGTVSSDFGFRIHPITGEYTFHSGIDLAADEGTDIHAAYDGTVVFAGYDDYNGNYIKIDHGNGLMTVYCHCKEIYVKEGDVLRGGEIVAAIGSTGSSTGPHLHFEIRINNVSYNPKYALSTAVNEL